MNTKIEYKPHIDGLRALAVISVLLFHLDIPTFRGGFVGVDIFLVISGYLITRLIKAELETTGKFSFKNFYIRRIRRLFPALSVTLILTTFFAAFLFSPSHLQRFGGELASAIVSLSNFYFWYEADYFDVSAKVKPLLHTWSLSIEEQFYLIWPATLVVIFKTKQKKLVPLILLAIALVSIYLNIKFSDGEVSFISKYFPSLKRLISNVSAAA